MNRNPALETAFSQGLLHVTRAWRREADLALARYGLSQATAWPLVHIGRLGGGVRQGALADIMGIEGPSLVRLLDHLCAAGLVERREDPSDRRAKALHLTPEGAALRGRIETVLADLRSRLLRTVSEADLEACLRVFRALEASIGRDAFVPAAGVREATR